MQFSHDGVGGFQHGSRRILALVAGVAMVGTLGLLQSHQAQAADKSVGYSPTTTLTTRLQTIPSLDSWQETPGAFTIGAGTRVVSQEQYRARAELLAHELSAFTGEQIEAAVDQATSSDIQLIVDPSQAQTLGEEGFTLTIGAQGFSVTGASEIGMFYGTRAVSQLFRQSQHTILAGTVTSVPKYRERGATLCACQINISPDWIDRFLENMADLRLNYLLMEMKLKPESENTKKAATWSYYTRDDVARFVQKARRYGIDVIPEINSPGHMNIWLENYPEYQLRDQHGTPSPDRLDIANPDAVAFYKTLIDEYDGVFDTKYWHMGADEYMIASSFSNYPSLQSFAEEKYGQGATPNDAFTGFINDINAYVKAKGKKLRIWNDGIVETKKVTLDKDIIVEYWYNKRGGRSPQDLIHDGYQLMNASQRLYWSRSARGYTVDTAGLYNWKAFSVGTFDGDAQVDPNDPNILGAKVSIWPDRSDVQTENEVEQQIQDGLRLIAQMTWSASRPWESFQQMKQTIDAIGQPLANRNYEYQPVRQGSYDIALLESVAPGPWELITTPDGYYQVRNKQLGTCLNMDSDNAADKHLDVVTASGVAPTLVACVDATVAWDATNTDANKQAQSVRNKQKWQIRRAAEGKFTLAPALTQQRLVLRDGALVQVPPDEAADQAQTSIVAKLSLAASADPEVIDPAHPSTVSVTVNAADTQNSGPVRVKILPVEGVRVSPEYVDLASIPQGKSARALFSVGNTTASGQVTMPVVLMRGDAELARTTLTLQAQRYMPVSVSDPMADSQAPEEGARTCGMAQCAFDGSLTTFWHTSWSPVEVPAPHWIAFKAQTGSQQLRQLLMMPRQDRLNGLIRDYDVYVIKADTADNLAAVSAEQWGSPVVSGSFSYSGEPQPIDLPESVPAGDVYVKLVAKRMYPLPAVVQEGHMDAEGTPFTSIAELRALVQVQPAALPALTQPSDNPVASPHVRVQDVHTGEPISQAEQGQWITLVATDFRPGEQVQFSAHSTPILLGSAIPATDAGTASLTVSVPQSLNVGEHTIIAQGNAGSQAHTTLLVLADTTRVHEGSQTDEAMPETQDRGTQTDESSPDDPADAGVDAADTAAPSASSSSASAQRVQRLRRLSATGASVQGVVAVGILVFIVAAATLVLKYRHRH